MEPINYTLGAQSPMQAFQSALALGSDIQKRQAEALTNQAVQEEAQAALQRQEQVQALMSKITSPNATAQDYLTIAMFLPKDQSEAVRESYKLMQDTERQAALSDTSQIFTAFKAGRPDIAVKLIREQATAERSSGNKQGAALAEEWANMADESKEGASAVETMLGYTIALMPGGDKAIDGAIQYATELRDQQEFPVLFDQKQAALDKATSDAEKARIDAKYARDLADAKLRKDVADALVAETEAAMAPRQIAAEVGKAEADAQTAQSKQVVAASEAEYAGRMQQAALDQALASVGLTMSQADKAAQDAAIAAAVEARNVALFPDAKSKAAADAKAATAAAAVAENNAKYAEKIALATLSKHGKDLALTDAQIAKAVAEGRKVSAETSKILMETEALKKAGGATPETVFNFESRLRTEYQSRTKVFTETEATYAQMQSAASAKTGAGDVALVYGFMKLLDPMSVVRESEFAAAYDTAGLYSRLKALGTKVQNGQMLDDVQRTQFMQLAGQFMQSSRAHESSVKKDLGMVVRNYGLNPSNVFGASVPNLPAGTGVSQLPTQSPSGPTDLAGLRAFIRKNNPATKMSVDTMTEAQLAESFPNGYAAYRAQVRPQPATTSQNKTVEVDY